MDQSANWKYANEMGHWLNSMQFNDEGKLSTPWNYWFTGTFKYEATLKSARRSTQNFIKGVNPDLAFWVRRVARKRVEIMFMGFFTSIP